MASAPGLPLLLASPVILLSPSVAASVVVVTLASLQGWPIEDLGYRLGRAWGIGEKGKNTGALVIIAPKERAVRIEVGYGLEGKLTDALSRAIIERDLVPAFRQRDFDRGVLAGTQAVLGALGGEPKATAVPAERSQQDDPLSALFLLILIFFVVFAVFGRRGHWVGPVIGGIWSGPVGVGRHIPPEAPQPLQGSAAR